MNPHLALRAPRPERLETGLAEINAGVTLDAIRAASFEARFTYARSHLRMTELMMQ